MFKYIVSAVLSFGTTAACCAQEIPQEVKLPFGLTAHPALVYAGAGNIHLLVKDFEMALEDFRRASYCAEQCDPDTAGDVQALVLFGQVIAYDNLNERAQCERALCDLILLSKEEEEVESDGDGEDDEFWDNLSVKNIDQAVSKMATYFSQLYLASEALKIMNDLAKMAPSEDVRTTLLAIINDELDE